MELIKVFGKIVLYNCSKRWQSSAVGKISSLPVTLVSWLANLA